MGMGADIVAVYGRAGAFARAMPWPLAVPVAIELTRQTFAVTGQMAPYGPYVFTGLSTLAMLGVMTLAMRWWRFGEDRRRFWAMDARVALGVFAFIAIQLFDEIMFTKAGHKLAALTGLWPFVPAAQLCWLLVSVPLYPWYVAMLTDDPLTFRGSVAAIRPRWLYGFCVVFGSIVPMLVITMALRFARTLDPSLGWQALATLGDGLLIAAMTIITDAAYFAVYRMVRPASG